MKNRLLTVGNSTRLSEMDFIIIYKKLCKKLEKMPIYKQLGTRYYFNANEIDIILIS